MRDRPSIAVLVLDGFSTLSLGAIVEPFRVLREKFPAICPDLLLFGLKNNRARARSGLVVECEDDGVALSRRMMGRHPPKTLLVCGGTSGILNGDDRAQILGLLRLAVRQGIAILSIGSTTWLLAEAGLLVRGRATDHWSLMAALQEKHPQLDVENALFLKNGKLTSCAGELAALDLIIDLIRSLSPAAARVVADFLLISSSRAGESRQPGSIANRLRDGPDQLAGAIHIMAENIENPLAMPELVSLCGISLRQLERLFRKHLNATPISHYASLRLERAYELLTQTNLPFAEIAIASGFGSVSNLSKKVKAQFKLAPLEIREKSGMVRSPPVRRGPQQVHWALETRSLQAAHYDIVVDSA